MTRLLIVSGIRLYRDGLAQLINLHQDAQFHVVDALAALPATQADLDRMAANVILLDIALAGSHAAVRYLSRTVTAPPVVALGIVDSDDEVLSCAEAGAVGYVTREGSLEELIAVVRSAARGELLCSPRVAGALARRLAAVSGDPAPVQVRGRLSRREREVADLISQDLSNKEIAQRLNIEVATVKNHVHNLLEKLHVHRRSDAAFAVRVAGAI
jgi:two-component system nitrate/nitrite response regulator NarL